MERLTSQKDVEKSQLDAAQTELTRLDNELRAMGVEVFILFYCFE